VFALGLGEDNFPARAGVSALDLRSERRTGDVSPRDRDRYGFFETILCAREHVVLSYVAREPVSGEARSPSTVLHELAEMLAPYLDAASDPLFSLTTKHPLHRFDPAYEALPPSAVTITPRERHAVTVRSALEAAASASGASVLLRPRKRCEGHEGLRRDTARREDDRQNVEWLLRIQPRWPRLRLADLRERARRAHRLPDVTTRRIRRINAIPLSQRERPVPSRGREVGGA
jgi:hypothetical protein